MTKIEQLAKWIREGKSPAEIRKLFAGTSCRLRRALRSKKLRAELELDAELAGTIAAYRTAAGVGEMTRRLEELTCSDNDETARKATVTLLNEGLETSRDDAKDRKLSDAGQLLLPLACQVQSSPRRSGKQATKRV